MGALIWLGGQGNQMGFGGMGRRLGHPPPPPTPLEQVLDRGLCAIAQAESLRYKLLGGLAVRRRARWPGGAKPGGGRS